MKSREQRTTLGYSRSIIKIIFFGTPDFAAETLAYIIEKGVDVCAVVTRPDKPKGRSGQPVPTAVKKVAQKLIPNIPIYQPVKASDPTFYPTLEQYQADLFVVVAYGEIIKEELLQMPRLACINVHASLLPKYRGAAPIQWSIINGEAETGVTIMHMVKKMDAGDIIRQAKVRITRDMTAGELHDLLLEEGKKVLYQVIMDFEKGAVNAYPQDPNQVTFAPKLELEDCEVDWSRSASELHNLIRGVTPFPGAWCQVELKGQPKRMKILETGIVMGYSDEPGTLLTFGKEGMIVSCGDEALRIKKLQVEGKKPVTGEEFANGISANEIDMR